MTKKETIKIRNRLRDLRKRLSLSQEELAERLGVSRQSVIALEQGKYLPSLPLVVSLCNLFNSAFEEIFEFERQVDKIVSKHLDQVHNHKTIAKNKINNKTKEVSMPSELEPWRPFREAISLRDAIDRLFEDSFITPRTVGAMPKIDIKETKDNVVVRAELPGIEEDKVNVEIMDNIMTISGEKEAEKEAEGEGFYYKESHSGAFQRSFTLPTEVKAEQAEAEMKNGVLTITIPKVEEKKAKKISIKSKGKK